MKKQLTMLMLAIIHSIVWGQPTIDNAENFTIGTILKFQISNPTGVTAGNPGANQTWNFSNLIATPDTITEWMVSPSSTSQGYLFPTANQVEKYSDGRFVYVNKTVSENYIVGFVDTTASYPPTFYTDPMLFAKRPLNFRTIVTDTFRIAGSSGIGIVTLNPDAYGTLILPNGTYNNVLRVKITEVHPWFNYTVYVWFDGVHNSSLLKIDNQPDVAYLLSETTEISKTTDPVKYNYYPNPSSNHILFNAEETGVLTITNNLGQLALKISIKDKQTYISTENLKAGIYYLTFNTMKQKTSSKLIIQR
jgi:hypothetical protein